MINVLYYSGSDMAGDYEFFTTNASKENSYQLIYDMEKENYNCNQPKALDHFKKDYIYHILQTSLETCHLSQAEIKDYFTIDLEIDTDLLADLIEKESEIKERIISNENY